MRELFYTSGLTPKTQIMSVPITTASSLAAGVPRVLWEGPLIVHTSVRGYDVTPDGQHFLIVQEKDRPPTPVTQLVMVQNWFEELKRLAK